MKTPSIKIGEKFGRLEVISFEEVTNSNNKTSLLAVCLCICGNNISIFPYKLKKGARKSCGCYFNGITKHPHYSRWVGMKNRCLNPNTENYERYGGAGVKICEGLHDFFFFLKKIGLQPSPEHTIDRIDSTKHYSCGECVECLRKKWILNIQWATISEQNRNKKNAHYITYKGETLLLEDWAKRLKIKRSTLSNRINTYKWDIERAFTEPIIKKNRIYKTKAGTLKL